MSKLIVEMEMPTNCKKCPLVGMDHFGQIRCKGQGGRLIHLKNFQTEIERPSWCPIKGELVRCKECKYFVKNTWECSRLGDRFGDEYADARVYLDWFCADGERRTE